MTKDEIAKNIANRFVHSQTYIILYLAMAALSITTVVLSLVSECPTLPFYILEFIINLAMILEVGIRFVAFGRVSDDCRRSFVSLDLTRPQQFWKSLWNVMDLVITAFCVITLLVIFFSGCDNTSKEEELVDTLLLVARNVLQFGRLATVMRQYVFLLLPVFPDTLFPASDRRIRSHNFLDSSRSATYRTPLADQVNLYSRARNQSISLPPGDVVSRWISTWRMRRMRASSHGH